MTTSYKPLDVLLVGGGMITNDLLLPSLYHLQRTGIIRSLKVCALNSAPLKALADNADFDNAFPGQKFIAYPDLDEPESNNYPDLYRELLAEMEPRQIVVVALPDQMHYKVVMEALDHSQNVLCVKPLVLKYTQTVEIKEKAGDKGLFVGVEYHKRFDRRVLLARRHYRQGDFGEFAIGDAKLIEPYFYRTSNFQNWFTTDKTDPFVYVGSHYVDMVYFITGLKPVEVSVVGLKGKFPNGNEGYMWANARVRYENGAILSVTDGLGYPDDAAGSNDQCLHMFFEGNGKTGLLSHDDQFRGVEHSFRDSIGFAGAYHNYVNPDFLKLVEWEGAGLKPIGYGFDSVAAIINAIHSMEQSVAGITDESAALTARREFLGMTDKKGLIATPANSYINELVVEAARLSIEADGMPAIIEYGNNPQVKLKYV